MTDDSFFASFPQGILPVLRTNRWIQWSGAWNPKTGKMQKRPCNRYGVLTGYNKADNHRSFQEVWTDLSSSPYGAGNVDNPVMGAGFAPAKSNRFLFIDIDGCRDPASGKLTDTAAAIVEACNTYTEVSPSGTGLRIVGASDGWPGAGKASYRWADGLEGEVYYGTGFVTITFNVLPGYADKWSAIGAVGAALLAENVGPRRDDAVPSENKTSNPNKTAPIHVIREALQNIPNTGINWDYWKSFIGILVYASSEGSGEGLDVWREWSRQLPEYQEGDCETAWEELDARPPTTGGFGSLRAEAQRCAKKTGTPLVEKEWLKHHRIERLGALPKFESMSASPPQGNDTGATTTATATTAPGDMPTVEFGVGDAGSNEGSGWTSIDTGDVGDWQDMLLMSSRTKEPKPNLLNTQTILRYATPWMRDGGMFYDTFGYRTILVTPPPWVEAGSEEWKTRELAEHDTTYAAIWMQRLGVDISAESAFKVIQGESQRLKRSTLRDYLESLEWDGVPRCDTLLIDYLGAEDTEINRIFTAKTLISAVARGYNPGCRVKTVLTLEGDQNIGKSKFCASLVPNPSWFTDTCPDIQNKDAAQQLIGIWIQEHSEMATMSKTDAARIKAFVSTGTDRYRPTFGKVAADFPRQCIFIATVNPGSNGYLKDETGASRFWPVACGVDWDAGRTMDGAALTAARDQLWAEAVTRYKAGETWWLDELAPVEEQARAAGQRYEVDVWEDRIAVFLATHRAPVTVGDVLKTCVEKPVGQWTKTDEMRVASILKRLGRVKKRIMKDGIQLSRYVDPTWEGDVVQMQPNTTKSASEVAAWAEPSKK